MPFDSNDKSPCIGCNLQHQSKVTREKQGSASFRLRNECKNCKLLDDYKTSSMRLYVYHDKKVVHSINKRALIESANKGLH